MKSCIRPCNNCSFLFRQKCFYFICSITFSWRPPPYILGTNFVLTMILSLLIKIFLWDWLFSHCCLLLYLRELQKSWWERKERFFFPHPQHLKISFNIFNNVLYELYRAIRLTIWLAAFILQKKAIHSVVFQFLGKEQLAIFRYYFHPAFQFLGRDC